ncbi:hypothetical protein BWK63_07490 [Flavobacterium covae]|uniref:Uncharacterized protein n=1 Tax=Flavobacterium covae TaxID=2906076 RepID=A0ABW8PI63_9FLAO|nr:MULTISPECIES: hypothetical protein [Flavobacterium]OWP81146.1 hypothetical protein BWK63_07490 [Flavobacterium covae]POR22761.1 hypothetical protein BWK57_04760 [Flavobacterium columnare]
MIRDILDKYCVLLKKEVFEDFSSYALLVELKHYLPSLKSEILLNCISYENNKKEEYLKYVINEITNSTFDINYSENNLKKWLVKYDISLDKILNDHITHQAIYNKLNADYNKYDGFENGLEKQLLFNIQDEFNKYFSKIYANYVIDFCISNIPLKNSKIESLDISENNYKDTYFDKFCELIDDYTILKKSTAIGVMIDLQLCIKEIKSETLLELQQKDINRNDHLEFKINEVEKCNYDNNADIHYVEKWLKNYSISIEEILNNTFQSSSITGLIDSHYNDMEKFSKEKDLAYDIQADFYLYFCKYYADELIEYFKSKMTISETNIIETENVNQLSVNQAIILLDKLGVFTDKTFENLPNTKKAKLISQLLGRNEKNIKTAIEKLELKPSEITTNYKKDIDKIERILNNLE